MSFGEVVFHEIVKKKSEDLPVLQITGSGEKTLCLDESMFTADSEDEEDDDNCFPLSQMEEIKAEDCMSDYKSSLTEEFDDNSQESEGVEDKAEYDEEDEDGDESVSEESEDGENAESVKAGDDGDSKLSVDVENPDW